MICSALVIEVPESEPLVKPLRDRFDTSAANGMPAHITVLFPFVPPGQITTTILDQARATFKSVPGFTVYLVEPRTFPHGTPTLYLDPVPSQPIAALTGAVCDRFPGYPPYGGLFNEVIPHLTVAQSDDRALFDVLVAEFRVRAAAYLPIPIAVTEVSLWENSSGRWSRFCSFPLGAAQ